MALNKHSSPVKQTVAGDGREGHDGPGIGAKRLNTAAFNRTKCIGESEQAGKSTPIFFKLETNSHMCNFRQDWV